MATPFSTPQDFTTRGPDLKVALLREGRFDWTWSDPETGHIGRRLRVENVANGIQEEPTAELTIRLAGEHDAAGDTLDRALKAGEIPALLHPDTRLVVYAEIPEELPGGGPSTRRFLFDGYPTVTTLAFNGARNAAALEAAIGCTSLLARLRREPAAQIAGRQMVARDGSVVAVDALAPVFNFEHKGQAGGNRHPTLQTVGGRKTPVFTYDGDPKGRPWSYADALTYLLTFYLEPLGETYAPRDGNGREQCAWLIESLTAPEELGDTAGLTFDRVARCRCDELNLQGRNLVEALQMWCAATGCTMQVTTRNAGGEPESVLLFAYNQDGGPYQDYGTDTTERRIRTLASHQPPAPRAIPLEKESTAPSDGTPKSAAVAARLTYDAGTVLASCRVIGKPTLHEVTAGRGPHAGDKRHDTFIPGWKPDAVFGDNLTGQALETKVDEILTASEDATANAYTLWARYTRGGPDHASYAHVGRLWVLDEANELAEEADTYARTNGGSTAWNTERYAAGFSFHVNCGVPYITADDGVTGRPWVARRRRMLPPLSRLVGAASTERTPIVLASWDAGTKWYPYPGNARILEDRVGVILTDESLAAEALACPAKPEESTSSGFTVWEAIVRGTFRLAATFAVEGDARLAATSRPNAKAYTNWRPERLLVTRDTLKKEQRESSSLLKADPRYTFTDRNETAAAQSLADRVVAVSFGRLVSGFVLIPWLTADYQPGDIITGLQPRGISFDAGRNAAAYPQVVSIRWENGPNGQHTELVLGDRRRAIRRAEVFEA